MSDLHYRARDIIVGHVRRILGDRSFQIFSTDESRLKGFQSVGAYRLFYYRVARSRGRVYVPHSALGVKAFC